MFYVFVVFVLGSRCLSLFACNDCASMSHRLAPGRPVTYLSCYLGRALDRRPVYLLDSIMKNCPEPYIGLATPIIHRLFLDVYNSVDGAKCS